MGPWQNDGAPVVQLLLTASFTPTLPDLTILDLADVVKLYQDKLPVFGQIVRAGPMGIAPSNEVPHLTQVMGLPRISMSTGNARDVLYMQDDRLSFGWNRTGSLEGPHDYPGFSETLLKLKSHLETLLIWARAKDIQLSPAVGEVVYTDAFLLTEKRQPHDIFTSLSSDDQLIVDQLEYNWGRRWTGDREGFVFGTAKAPTLSPEGDAAATLETTARFQINGDWDGLDAGFFEAHSVITDIFKGLVKPEARFKSDA